MKSYLYIFLLYSTIGFSQVNAIVEYKLSNNTDRSNTLYCTLFIDGTNTIYLPKYSTKVRDDEKRDTNLKSNYPDLDYLKIDHTQQQILFFDAIVSNDFLIKDDYNKLNWVISGESKTIGGYQCLKATTSFRGMDWVAWFSPEVALPYGPWKLHGLPGLIMEAHETTNTYKWTIEKIEYKKSDIFDKDFKTLVKTKNKEPISLRKFLEDQKEYYGNVQANHNQKNGNHMDFPVPPRKYELKYEWEE